MASERVFEKDGHEVTTSSPSAAVDLKARGYREVIDPTPKRRRQAQTGGPDTSAAQPTPPKPDRPKSD